MENKNAVTETPAELEDVIRKVLDIDSKAKEITVKAKNERAAAERNILKSKAELREKYITRAKEKIEQLRSEEEKLADEAIKDAATDYEQKLSQLEADYAAGKDKWADEIFKLITAND